MKNFRKRNFLIWTLIFGLLLIPSFLAAWAEDEGTIGTNFLWITFAKLFNIFRFPTHTLLWTLITKFGATIYFLGLAINCIFYGIITERLIYFYKTIRKDIAN